MRPVLIMCAGRETRMGAALRVPKSHIRVNGERLIERTLRLVGELSTVTDHYPYIVTCDPHWYEFPETHVVALPEEMRTNLFTSIVSAMRSLKLEDQATVLLGDVCWSRASLRLACKHSMSMGVMGPPFAFMLGRFEPSKVTGKSYDERFAVVATRYEFEQWQRFEQLKELSIPKLHVPLDDFTEDFDFPHELDTILPNVARAALKEG